MKKMNNRKKFLTTIGTGIFSFLVVKFIPFNFFGMGKSKLNGSKIVDVKINPLAVRRRKAGDKNV